MQGERPSLSLGTENFAYSDRDVRGIIAQPFLKGLARILGAWYSTPCRRSAGGEQAPCQQNTAHKKFSSQCFCKIFMESLILAQDERWRRA